MMTTVDGKIGYLEKLALIGRDGRLTVLSFMTFAFFWGVNDVIFNLYMIEAGFGEDFIGFFLSISLFVIAVCAIPAGMFTDRRSRKKILLGGNVIYLLAVALQYSTLSSILLIISQVLLGLSYSFVGVAWTPYTISVTTKEERIHLFSIRFAFFVIASFLGYLIGGFLPSICIDFGFAFDLLSAYRLTLWFGLVPLALGVVFIIPMSVDVPQNGEISWGLGNVKNWEFIAKYTIPWTMTGLGAGLFILFFNIFFNRMFSADTATIGIIFALNTVALIIGHSTSPLIVDRLGKAKSILITQALSLPFLLTLFWSPNLIIAVTAYICRNVFMNMGLPILEVFFMEGLKKEEQATAMGVINSGDAVARGVGTNIGGQLLAAGLLTMPFLFAAILYTLAVILFYFFFGRKKPEAPGKIVDVKTAIH